MLDSFIWFPLVSSFSPPVWGQEFRCDIFILFFHIGVFYVWFKRVFCCFQHPPSAASHGGADALTFSQLIYVFFVIFPLTAFLPPPASSFLFDGLVFPFSPTIVFSFWGKALPFPWRSSPKIIYVIFLIRWQYSGVAFLVNLHYLVFVVISKLCGLWVVSSDSSTGHR